jgi:threonine dehydrogenase-like Zn-dependent dehydrogenase
VIHALKLGAINPAKSTLIMGQGVSGLILTHVARFYSPKVLAVTDFENFNMSNAKRYRATHTYQVLAPDASRVDVARNDFPDAFDVNFP